MDDRAHRIKVSLNKSPFVSLPHLMALDGQLVAPCCSFLNLIFVVARTCAIALATIGRVRLRHPALSFREVPSYPGLQADCKPKLFEVLVLQEHQIVDMDNVELIENFDLIHNVLFLGFGEPVEKLRRFAADDPIICWTSVAGHKSS